MYPSGNKASPPNLIILLFITFIAILSGCEGKKGTEQEVGVSHSDNPARTQKLDSIQALRFVQLGDSLLVRREFVDAQAAYNSALEKFEHLPDALRKRAWINYSYLSPDDSASWEEDWQKARLDDPERTPESLEGWSPFSE